MERNQRPLGGNTLKEPLTAMQVVFCFNSVSAFRDF